MEFVIISLVIAIGTTVMKYIFGANIKKLKSFAENEKLDKIVGKFPTNIEVCKSILKKLKNEKVKIEEVDEQSSMYIAVGNTIKIGKIQKSYTRIQTIAHECLHSIQDRKILIINFILSNIFFIYFIVISALRILKNEFIVTNQLLFFSVLAMLGFSYYAIRVYLENDAMIKARYLAKEYMEEEKVASKDEIKELVEEYDKINDIGIKCVNYNIFLIVSIILFIFSILCTR